MGFVTLDPDRFLQSDLFRQDEFLAGIESYDWSCHLGQKVLVRGCGDIHTPPWAFMAIATRLVGIARSVRYGNEHDNVLIYRNILRRPRNAPSDISA